MFFQNCQNPEASGNKEFAWGGCQITLGTCHFFFFSFHFYINRNFSSSLLNMQIAADTLKSMQMHHGVALHLVICTIVRALKNSWQQIFPNCHKNSIEPISGKIVEIYL